MNSNEYQFFTSSALLNSLNVSSDQLKKELATLISNKIIEPIYRINSDEYLLDFENKWTSDLLSLSRTFEVSERPEQVIDGSIPENIEVAFRFLRQPKETKH